MIVSRQLIRICQIYPSTIPPIRFGIKKTVLKILVPFNFCVRSSARPNASTLISKIDTIANNTVNLNELVKDVSLIAAV